MGWYYKEPKLTKCPGCGTEFWRVKWTDKRHCNPLCTGARLTDYDKKVLSDYRAMCTRHHLSVPMTWQQLTGKPSRHFYYLTERLNCGWGRFSTATKNRYIAVIKRIVDDFNAGMYEVTLDRVTVDVLRKKPMLMNRLERRLSPGRPECPMKLSHCAGGLYPGDCPRHWRECPLWSN